MDQHVDDADLLARWASGCRTSGALLFERHGAALYRFFYTKAPEAAEDLTQATLLACLEKTEQLCIRHSFRSYMFGIARHMLYSHYRTGRTHRGKPTFNTTSVFDARPSPSTLLSRQNEDVALMRALATLPVEMRIVLELTYWEDMPSAGLAEVIGVAENTIHSRLHRAKQRLRLALERLESS